MATLNFVKGKPTKVHIGNLTGSQVAAATFVAPSETPETITLSSAVLVTDTTLAVNATTNQIPAGTALTFESGTAPNIVQTVYYVTEDADAGATSLTIEEAGKAQVTAATAEFIGLVCLNGGTTAGFQISTTDTTTDVFDCANPGAAATTGALGGFTDGLATAAAWSSPFNGNLVAGDPGFARLQYLGVYALAGARGYLKLTSETPAGFADGYVRAGIVQVLDYSESYESTGLVTVSATLQGRGDPDIVAAPASA